MFWHSESMVVIVRLELTQMIHYTFYYPFCLSQHLPDWVISPRYCLPAYITSSMLPGMHDIDYRRWTIDIDIVYLSV